MGASISSRTKRSHRNRPDTLCEHVLQKEWDQVIARSASHPHEARYIEDGTSGYTALHFACYLDAPPAVVRALLEAYPDAAATREDIKGLTPLHIACYFGRDVAARLLIQADAGSSTVKTSANSTPLDLVCIQLKNHFVAHRKLTAEEGEAEAIRRLLITKSESSKYIAITTLLIEAIYHKQNRASGKHLWREATLASLECASAGKEFRLVHACAELTEIPLIILRIALVHHREQVIQRDKGGNLPLHLALRSGRSYEAVEAIVRASPSAVTERLGTENIDGKEEGGSGDRGSSGLYPFMQAAAAASKEGSGTHASSLDAIYLLLRTCPELGRFGYAAR